MNTWVQDKTGKTAKRGANFLKNKARNMIIIVFQCRWRQDEEGVKTEQAVVPEKACRFDSSSALSKPHGQQICRFFARKRVVISLLQRGVHCTGAICLPTTREEEANIRTLVIPTCQAFLHFRPRLLRILSHACLSPWSRSFDFECFDFRSIRYL